ncbi:GntR family transcriptional regulator [Streptomyces sp. HUAS TT7]|uniref:GntR family transcriptional regulator n=1 Tax=Streptomyces sp. HUAS TT7 TaxID=3447507 RepID=UPI003F65DF09
MSQQASPRGTFLMVAAAVKGQIEADPKMEELPLIADLMAAHEVSRGVVIRAFDELRKEGLAEPAPGGRWRVVRSGVDRRPLVEQIADLFADPELKVGAPFPSASELARKFGVARPTVTKALERLESAGLLSEGSQGRVRTVLAMPNRGERSSS